MKKILYIVHAIDTEGPLYQSHKEYKKYSKEVKRNDNFLNNNQLFNVLADKLTRETIGTKKKLIKNLKLIGSRNFRSKYLDDFKGKWVYNWFILNHNGWNGKNPRKRILGPFGVFDLYKNLSKSTFFKKDGYYFHYHPKPLSEDYHRAGYTVSNSDHLTSTLARLLIDKDYFPSCFRAGHTAERFDLHIFLEQWIPFDYSNHSLKTNKLKNNTVRFGNWKYASKKWLPYHPDFYDYQKKGNCNRLIIRSLPIFSRNYCINDKDVSEAFLEAKKSGKAILSFFGHDFKNMEKEIQIIREKIFKFKKKYKDVKIKFSRAIDAVRAVNNIKNNNFKLSAKIQNKKNRYSKLIIESNNEIFGSQPFLAIKYKNKYYWQNFDYESKYVWSYTFDEHNLLLNDVQKLSIGSNSKFGDTIILKFNKKTKKFKKIINKN